MAGIIRVGVAGWSYRDWEGIVYPAAVKSSGKLAYLAEYFDMVEINTSFYGPIKAEVGRQWCRVAAAVNPDFTFTAKLYRAFTHAPVAAAESTSAATIRPELEDEADVKRGFDALASEGRLGAVLAQFPISFKYTGENRDYLEKLLARFGEYPLVLEIGTPPGTDRRFLAGWNRRGWGFATSISRYWAGPSGRPRGLPRRSAMSVCTAETTRTGLVRPMCGTVTIIYIPHGN